MPKKLRAEEYPDSTATNVLYNFWDTCNYGSNIDLFWDDRVKEIRDPREGLPHRINYCFERKILLENRAVLKRPRVYNRLLFSISGYLPKNLRNKKCNKH